MFQEITKSAKMLVDEANKLVDTISIKKAQTKLNDNNYIFIDVRDYRELKREGKIPGSFSCPRGMLEFWIDPDSPYTSESYDAAAIIILYNYAKIYSENNTNDIIYDVSNKPGIKIYPGEIKKAIKILRDGKKINYEGATGVEFDEFGDTFGSFVEVDFKKGKLKGKKLR